MRNVASQTATSAMPTCQTCGSTGIGGSSSAMIGSDVTASAIADNASGGIGWRPSSATVSPLSCSTARR